MIPPAPAAPVTLPVANALVMLPVLNATSPPAVPFEPTLTAPLADEPAIVPGLVPTSPPAKLSVPPLTIAPVADQVRDRSQIGGNQPARNAAVAGLHVAEGARRLNRAEIAADEPAGLQVRDERTTDIAARPRARNQPLIGAGEPAQRLDVVSARRAANSSGRI